MLRAILWDHDGVLVDTERLYFRATRAVLAGAGVALGVQQYRQLLLVEGRGAWHLAAERGVSEAGIAELRRERNERYLKMLLEEDVVVPGVLDLLRRLGQRYRMAVVTSAERVHFDAIHQATGLRDLVEFVLTRQDYGEAKPHPEPYLRAVEKLGLPKEQCLVVEDSERGFRAAEAAGLRCWMVYSEMTSGLAFDDAERHFVSLKDLGEVLLAL